MKWQVWRWSKLPVCFMGSRFLNFLRKMNLVYSKVRMYLQKSSSHVFALQILYLLLGLRSIKTRLLQPACMFGGRLLLEKSPLTRCSCLMITKRYRRPKFKKVLHGRNMRFLTLLLGINTILPSQLFLEINIPLQFIPMDQQVRPVCRLFGIGRCLCSF